MDLETPPDPIVPPAPVVEDAPTAHMQENTIKFTNLQFGRNYDPTTTQ